MENQNGPGQINDDDDDDDTKDDDDDDDDDNLIKNIFIEIYIHNISGVVCGHMPKVQTFLEQIVCR